MTDAFSDHAESILTETRCPNQPGHTILSNDAARKGVSTARFRISKQDGERIREIERTNPDLALAELLRMLRARG